ncbi:RIIa domain-containing protein 1-like [Rhopilema esculentum]|uniref:RIIa domain-containing protein 1-like n=1 Tax=Rhopilema esculentum TaxID=499914 RepID=UPI0031D18458
MDKTGGLENNDLGALTKEQQGKLNEYKIKTRFANEKYIRSHPEIGCLLSSFVSDVLSQRPENTREFAAAFFSNPELPLKVKALTQNQLSKVKSSQ